MKRTHEVKLRLNDSEFEAINGYVLKAGYTSREKYMRAVLMKNVPKEQPPIEYHKLINEFNSIGNNLNQLVKLAYNNPIIEDKANQILEQLRQLIVLNESTIRGIT